MKPNIVTIWIFIGSLPAANVGYAVYILAAPLQRASDKLRPTGRVYSWAGVEDCSLSCAPPNKDVYYLYRSRRMQAKTHLTDDIMSSLCNKISSWGSESLYRSNASLIMVF